MVCERTSGWVGGGGCYLRHVSNDVGALVGTDADSVENQWHWPPCIRVRKKVGGG